MSDQRPALSFSALHTFRLSSFQVGSAMGDILVTSIWNRVLISSFGIPAAPVSLLIALRYLLSPLSLWAGFLSDTRPLWGKRRISYIWLGRGVMILSLPLLGLSLRLLGADSADVLGWTCATVSSLLYGIGTLVSGSPYLALVRDSAPGERQGLAISLVEIVLIVCFAAAGIAFSLWMKVYDERIYWEMILATMVVGGFFWFFAIANAEKRRARYSWPRNEGNAHGTDFIDTFKSMWGDTRTRRFFLFLSLATLSAWTQDAILEPFGAEVFGLPVERTTRLNSYWQGATVLTLVIGAYIWRKRPPELQNRIARSGLLAMALGMVVLGATAIFEQVRLLEVALLLFGGGFGVYTFGGVSLMAVMASDRRAGAYLGLWSISVLVSKGVGTFLGGLLRDLLLLNVQLSAAVSYGTIFCLEALGLLGAALILTRVDVLSFALEMRRAVSRVEAQIASAD